MAFGADLSMCPPQKPFTQITGKEQALVKIAQLEEKYLKPIHHFHAPYETATNRKQGHPLA